ncbi:CHAP domain-containing protein [Thermomonospora catenispora]|uniref:CHAP domain-containing protein n=1 Tax=Thermomonospora catenispora TaxID=2493090 RepID=UPI00111D6E34|nr:CHAP domain-containing protein [Thermomonospora catenispora]TNY35835.1 CHAP domain-containing protein [Thermomonospora catenispora]
MDPIGRKLLEVAEKELGYTEKAGGYTKYGKWWTEHVDADHDPYFTTAPWCDMFLAWAADKAGVTEQVGRFASTVEHAKWFAAHDAWGGEPEPGAIVFFDWKGSNDIEAVDHVGIVTAVDGGKIHTIEANVDGVHLRKKVRDESVIAGYGYPSKVKPAAQTAKYVPRHAAPPPSPRQLTEAPGEQGRAAATREAAKASDEGESLLSGPQDAVLTGLMAVAVVGSVALSVGKAVAAKMPTSSPVRIRKRGKHHRRPVALPPDVTPEQLDRAEAVTAPMPAVSAAVAAEAEDREFWGRIEHLKEDQELAFWDSLHAELAEASERHALPAGHRIPSSLNA